MADDQAQATQMSQHGRFGAYETLVSVNENAARPCGKRAPHVGSDGGVESLMRAALERLTWSWEKAS
jgi:hypothetical protein